MRPLSPMDAWEILMLNGSDQSITYRLLKYYLTHKQRQTGVVKLERLCGRSIVPVSFGHKL